MRFTGKVSTPTMYSYWADVTVDGKTYTSTRNYITLTPDANVASGITPKTTSDTGNARLLSDGTINDATGGNLARWQAPAGDENPSITYDLGKMQDLSRVNLFFNHHMPNADNVTYYNVPKKVKIEYSADGSHWTAGNETTTQSGGGLPTSRNTLAVPRNDTTLYAWEQEGLYYNYPVDPGKPSVPARYVRISFPGGGQDGSPIDILEARIFSLRDLTALGSLAASQRPAPTAGRQPSTSRATPSWANLSTCETPRSPSPVTTRPWWPSAPTGSHRPVMAGHASASRRSSPETVLPTTSTSTWTTTAG